MAGEAVLEIYSETGNLQVTGTGGIGYGLSATGNLTLVSDGAQHPQPMVVGTITVTGTNPVLAFKASGQVNVTTVTVNGSTVTYRLRAQSRVAIGLQWWLFDAAAMASKDPTLAGVAAGLYDEFGVMTFDASMAALRIAGVVETPKDSETIPNGPFTSLGSTSDFVVPAGKVYAIVQATPGFINTTYDTGAYSNSVDRPQQVEIGEGQEPPLGMRWRYQNLESYQSTGGYAGGNVIRVGMTRFEFFPGWNSADSTPHINVYGQARHLIVDVTNFVAAGGVDPTNINVAVNATARSVSTGGAQTISQSTTPTITATASGGGAPYSYIWEYVSGDASVVPTSAQAVVSTAFSTTTTNQPAGTTRSAVYRCWVEDANGYVGYSPDVTFTHVAEAYSVDVTPNSTTWGSVTINTNEPTGWNGTTSQIAGINQPITLRVERYDYSGNLSGCLVHVYRGPTANGPWTGLGSFDVRAGGFQYFDAVFTNGEFLHYAIDASTTERRRTGQFRLVVHNLTAGTQLSDLWNYVTVDADDNFTIPDYTLDAVGWDNISGSTSANDLSTANAYRTLGGINRNINLRATVSGLNGNLSAGSRLEMFVGGSLRFHSTNLSNGSWAGGDFAPGEQVAFVARAISGDGQARSGSYTVTVTNQTTGATVSQFVVNQSVAGADYTPDTIVWPTFSVASNDPDASWSSTAYGEHYVTGINRPVTIRFERYGYQGNLTALYFDCFTLPPGASSWTHHGFFSAHESGTRYLDVANVTNGTRIAINPHAISDNGRREGQCQTVVWALTNGSTQFAASGTNTFVVDADNNYIPPDWTPNGLSLSDISLNTNDPSGWTNNCIFTVSGINQTITLRFNRGNQVDSGGIFTRRLYIYRSSNGGASWDEYPIGAGANNTVDIAVNNGDVFHIRAYCDTTAGRGETSFTTWITNLTTGAGLGSFNCYATVDADNNHNVAGPPVVTITGTYLVPGHEFANPGVNRTVNVGQSSCTVTGGTAPFTYQWERIYGLSTWSISSPTSPTSSFSYTGRTNFTAEASFRLKVTDAQGRVAYSDSNYCLASAGNVEA